MGFRFPGTPDPVPFRRLDGVGDVEVHDNDVDLQVTGGVAPVLEAALAQGVVDVTAHHADLDELFLAYYRDTEVSA